MKIDSDDKKIDELLKANIFLIPRFQREYSWEPDHVSAFWSDILENLGEAYFIGAMVTYEVTRSTLAVVDGQQRLTTITILLCAIREAFKKLDCVDLAEGLQAFIEQKDRNNKTVYVLRTETSFPFLQEEILKSSPSDLEFKLGIEEEAIKRAFDIFQNNIEENVSKFFKNKEQSHDDNKHDAVSWLSKLRDTVFDLNLVLVVLDNEDDAYLIFETLNTRGKDLALADLLRNHFSKLIPAKSEVDQVKEKWFRVHDTIKSSPVKLDTDTFIVHSWQSRYDFVTKAKTFKKVKDRVTPKIAKAHLDRFVSDAEQWRSLFDTDYLWSKNENEVKRSLRALRTFRVVQPTPGILSLVRAYRDKVIRYKVLRDALSSIENFHFSFNAVTSSRSSGGISGMYSSFGRQIFECGNSNEAAGVIADLVSKLRDRRVFGSEFDAGFEQIIFTNKHSSQKALVQYILRKVAIFENQPFIGDTDDLTIEHLLPQSSSKLEGDDAYLGQIGNLMLVDQKTNQLLSAKKFREKKVILLERGYKLPILFEHEDQLNAESIRRNTLRISELARENIWRV